MLFKWPFRLADRGRNSNSHFSLCLHQLFSLFSHGINAFELVNIVLELQEGGEPLNEAHKSSLNMSFNHRRDSLCPLSGTSHGLFHVWSLTNVQTKALYLFPTFCCWGLMVVWLLKTPIKHPNYMGSGFLWKTSIQKPTFNTLSTHQSSAETLQRSRVETWRQPVFQLVFGIQLWLVKGLYYADEGVDVSAGWGSGRWLKDD